MTTSRNGPRRQSVKAAAELERLRQRVDELEHRDAERERLLDEASAQQAAAADVLRVIPSAPGDLQHVLDAIAERAAALCLAGDAVIFRVDGVTLYSAARFGPRQSQLGPVRVQLADVRPSPNWVPGHAVLERRTVHVPDTLELPAPAPGPRGGTSFERSGIRARLAAPLLREGEAIGSLVVDRAEPGPFTDQQVRLLESFAAQAVIAIENARLFSELHERLEEQTATGEVLRMMSESPAELGPVLRAVVSGVRQLCGADAARVFLPVGDGQMSQVAEDGPEGARSWPLESERARPHGLHAPDRHGLSVRAMLTRATVHVPDLAALTEADGYSPGPIASWLTRGVRAALAAPLLRGGEPIGVLHAVRTEPGPFSEQQVRLLETFANQAAVAIGNTRLFQELQQSNQTLTEALERQTATAEVLRIISSSPADLPGVVASIMEAAVRLCDAADGNLHVVEGDHLRNVTWHTAPGVTPVVPETGTVIASDAPAPPGPPRPNTVRRPAVPRARWRPLSSRTLLARAVRERRVLHVEDVLAPEVVDEYADTAEGTRRQDSRTQLAAPLLRGGEAIGVILVRRRGASRPFSEAQIQLLQSFADQAVIAMENSRLFTELQERLAEQTATAEVLRAISASPADLQTVLDTVAATAARLCEAEDVLIFRGDRHTRRLAAHVGTVPIDGLDERPVTRDTFVGRAMLDRATIHVPDVQAVAEDFPASTIIQRHSKIRTVLAAPLLSAGGSIGAICMRRFEVRPFTDRQIELLQTFASQAVIAIENARLFSELQESNATLKQALEQQTATADILRVIASSPTDLRGVLGVIAEAAARLCDARDALILRVEGGRLSAAAGHGPIAGGYPMGRGPDLDETSVAATAARTGQTIHVPDLESSAGEPFPDSREASRRIGHRAVLAAPMLRDGRVIGVILVLRAEPRAFAEQQIRLLETFADQASIAAENARLFSELRERDDRRRHELERAASIQQRLLPSSIEGWPGVLEIAHRFRPAVETSGDFYDVLALPAAHKGALEPLQIAVGDVAGKGMAAALVTALARSALQSTAAVPMQMATAAGTLRAAGGRLHRDVGSGHFVACALAIVEPPGLHNAGPLLRLANAAQVPVLLVRDANATEIEPPGYRLPLGAQPDGAYREAEVELRPGDVAVFSSDGLVEAPAQVSARVGVHLAPAGGGGELFGFGRLAESAAYWASRAESAEGVAAGIWSDLTGWCGEESHHDDVTLLVLRVPPAAGASAGSAAN